MEDRNFVFLVGLHRSGTSLLHEIVKEHPEIAGLVDTGAPEDEGQHVQTVYPTAHTFGGPGKFLFDERSFMDENDRRATSRNATLILDQWSRFIDHPHPWIVEKSPPTIARTRFFQQLFPNSTFIAILRHPLAVALATQKFSRTSVASLLDHKLRGYETLADDLQFLRSAYVLRYEDLVSNPQASIDAIFDHLGLASFQVRHQVRADVSGKYFDMWEQRRRRRSPDHISRSRMRGLEKRSRRFGYSLTDERRLTEFPLLGPHRR